MTYRINLRAIDEMIDILPGTNVMIDGPAMIGKGIFSRNIVYRALKDKQGVVIISAKETTSDITKWFELHGVDLKQYPQQWGIIDCLTYSLYPPDEREDDTDNVKYIDGAVNLTKIMYQLEIMQESFRSRGIEEIVIVMDSLSVYLMYVPLQPLFSFLHVLTGKVKEWDGCLLAIIDSDMHDNRTISTLKQVFQGTVEMRYQGDETAIRAMGLSHQPTPWFKFKKGSPKMSSDG